MEIPYLYKKESLQNIKIKNQQKIEKKLGLIVIWDMVREITLNKRYRIQKYPKKSKRHSQKSVFK